MPNAQANEADLAAAARRDARRGGARRLAASGCGVVSGACSPRAIVERLREAALGAAVDDPLGAIRNGQHRRRPSAAPRSRRDRRAIPRSSASMPTSSGATRVKAGRPRSSAAASVPKPRRVMSVSSSAKYADADPRARGAQLDAQGVAERLDGRLRGAVGAEQRGVHRGGQRGDRQRVAARVATCGPAARSV